MSYVSSSIPPAPGAYESRSLPAGPAPPMSYPSYSQTQFQSQSQSQFQPQYQSQPYLQPQPSNPAAYEAYPPPSQQGPPGGSMQFQYPQQPAAAWQQQQQPQPPPSVASQGRSPNANPAAEYMRKSQVRYRLDDAMQKRTELLGQIDFLTDGEYQEHEKKTLSLSRQANLDDVDWRVPRLMQCMDPKYLVGVDPAQAEELRRRKLRDGQVLEQQLGREATENWAKALQVVGEKPPPLEYVRPRPTAFIEAQPSYSAVDDVWCRTLELRTLDEALRGDVSKPLPRPAVHNEEYTNFREGRYVRDDCPIA